MGGVPMATLFCMPDASLKNLHDKLHFKSVHIARSLAIPSLQKEDWLCRLTLFATWITARNINKTVNFTNLKYLETTDLPSDIIFDICDSECKFFDSQKEETSAPKYDSDAQQSYYLQLTYILW